MLISKIHTTFHLYLDYESNCGIHRDDGKSILALKLIKIG